MRIIKQYQWLLCIVVLTGCHNHSNVVTPDARWKEHHFLAKEKKSYLKSKTKRASEPVQDGAPSGPLPVSFKKAIPVLQPISRYGNPATYKVDGKTYEVMTTSTGYRARGTASWYGTKFHQKRTSSGEDYDLYGLTAAHKTLPLPTYVKVKNLENGRELIVKVNDRGPFHADRIIDLSYGAAIKLGLLPKGTAQVEIEALAIHEKMPAARYYLQAGAFSSQNLAESLRTKLSSLTPSPVFVEPYKQYFVVKVGPFASKEMSENLKSLLLKKGVSSAFSLLQ